jgi:hypothetical protein
MQFGLDRPCFTTENEEIINENYEAMKHVIEPNPYWDKVTTLANKQRAKGLKDYGQGIEDNPAAVLDRLTYIEEELIDALMYLEWLREGLANVKN